MFTHDTKPDKTILIYSKHQLTLELSPLSEFRSLSEFRRPSFYTDSPFGSFWVNEDMDLTLTSRPASGTRQFVSICLVRPYVPDDLQIVFSCVKEP